MVIVLGAIALTAVIVFFMIRHTQKSLPPPVVDEIEPPKRRTLVTTRGAISRHSSPQGEVVTFQGANGSYAKIRRSPTGDVRVLGAKGVHINFDKFYEDDGLFELAAENEDLDLMKMTAEEVRSYISSEGAEDETHIRRLDELPKFKPLETEPRFSTSSVNSEAADTKNWGDIVTSSPSYSSSQSDSDGSDLS